MQELTEEQKKRLKSLKENIRLKQEYFRRNVSITGIMPVKYWNVWEINYVVYWKNVLQIA